MSVRLGNPQEVTFAAAALGGAAGRSMSLGGAANQWVLLVSILATYVASATVGNRVPVIQIKDSAGNILWQTSQGGNLTAGQTARLAAAGGVPAAAVTAPVMQTMPLPDGFSVPANATIVIFDNGNIDTTDTVAVNAVISS